MTHHHIPTLGWGLGLRACHYPYVFENKPQLDWFEIISENFMETEGRAKHNLARVRADYPVAMHGVSLSIGSADELNRDYLKKLKSLIQWLEPAWVTDHLCWTGIAHINTHDLLPVPYTEESLQHIINRIKHVQDFLGRRVGFENPSSYLAFKQSTLSEAQFLKAMVEESDSYLLLDVNNVYVSCFNNGWDAREYIDTLPLNRVIQIHLSGHSNLGSHIIDTHDAPIVDDVWALYQYTIQKMGRIPNVMIEWDDHIPEFPDLMNELSKAKTFAESKQEQTLPSLIFDQEIQKIVEIVPLNKTQTWFQNSVLKGENRDDQSPNDWIIRNPKLSTHDQLRVYQNAYRYRLYGVVEEDYPVMKYALGKDKFYDLIWSFVNKVPSTHFNVSNYALRLSEFITQDQPNDQFTKELCDLETAISQIAYADETQVLMPEHLQGMTPDSLMSSKLSFRKALQLFEFTYPVNDYYCKVMEKEDPTLPSLDDSYVVVFRHDHVVWRMDLDKDEHRLLEKLMAGQTVGNALADLDESIAAQLSNWFSRWMKNGLLAKV